MLAQSAAAQLTPGDYRWEPQIAPHGDMSMFIDLSSQHAFVYRDGKLIGISTISSGRPGHATPDGTFTVLEKEKVHHSNKYDDAPMPYMERLTWDGLALHAGHPRGWPASHGCIRLPAGFAAALFEAHTRGMQVVISGTAPSKAEVLFAAREKALAASPWQDYEASGWGGTNNMQATQYSRAQSQQEAPCCGSDDRGPRTPPVSGGCDAQFSRNVDSGRTNFASNQSGGGGCSADGDRRRQDPDELSPSDFPAPPS